MPLGSNKLISKESKASIGDKIKLEDWGMIFEHIGSEIQFLDAWFVKMNTKCSTHHTHELVKDILQAIKEVWK